MENMTIKNKRMKMSPAGVITLTVAARKSLGMKVNENDKVNVEVDSKCIVISRNKDASKNTSRISKAGQMVLEDKAKNFLEKSEKRHYWVTLDDEKKQVKLMAY